MQLCIEHKFLPIVGFHVMLPHNVEKRRTSIRCFLIMSKNDFEHEPSSRHKIPLPQIHQSIIIIKCDQEMATQRNCSWIWILVPAANGRFNVVVDLTVPELRKPDKKHSYVNLSYLVI